PVTGRIPAGPVPRFPRCASVLPARSSAYRDRSGVNTYSFIGGLTEPCGRTRMPPLLLSETTEPQDSPRPPPSLLLSPALVPGHWCVWMASSPNWPRCVGHSFPPRATFGPAWGDKTRRFADNAEE